jgi:CheY-like chemotaxis protein
MAPQTAMRVLVVEDNGDVAESTSRLLRMLGYESEVAANGQIALEKAVAFEPDLLLVDLAMPHLDGYELANRFRLTPAFGGTHMIAVSGYVDAAHRLKAAEVGFDGFVSKPFTKDDLEDVCKRVKSRIAETNKAIEDSRTAVEATSGLNERSRHSLGEFWLNRKASE